MGLVPMSLGQESLRHISSVSDSLSVGSPVSVESGDPLSDTDPRVCLEGVDCIGDMSDIGSTLEAYCAGGVHPWLSDVSPSEESEDGPWVGVMCRGDESLSSQAGV